MVLHRAGVHSLSRLCTLLWCEYTLFMYSAVGMDIQLLSSLGLLPVVLLQ